MCNFFSCNSNGQGKLYYFDWKKRQRLLKNNPKDYNPDSHTSVSDYFNLNDDKVNKYEYDPLTRKFTVDQINVKDDRALVKRKLDSMDWKKIVEPLIVKPIVSPLNMGKHKVTEKDIDNLKKCNSVRDSIWSSIESSICNSVGESVWYSVWDSIWASIEGSVWAYITSFFDIKYKHDFRPLVELWERGFIPSFDGKVLRLHQGKDAKVVYKLNV